MGARLMEKMAAKRKKDEENDPGDTISHSHFEEDEPDYGGEEEMKEHPDFLDM